MRINLGKTYLGEALQRILFLALRPFSFLFIAIILSQYDSLEGKEKKNIQEKLFSEIEINHSSTKRTWKKYLTNDKKSQLYWEPYNQNIEIESFNTKRSQENILQIIGCYLGPQISRSVL